MPAYIRCTTLAKRRICNPLGELEKLSHRERIESAVKPQEFIGAPCIVQVDILSLDRLFESPVMSVTPKSTVGHQSGKARSVPTLRRATLLLQFSYSGYMICVRAR